MQIEFQPKANQDLFDIYSYYVGNAGDEIAHKIIAEIYRSTLYLKDFPEIGKVNMEFPNVRELSVPRYVYQILYTINIEAKAVQVMRIFDTRQDPNKKF